MDKHEKTGGLKSMKKINMKKYTPKEFRKKKSVNKSYIRRMSRRIVNENVGIILAGTILGEILLSAAFVSASENEFNINERETIRIEQRAVWTDEENYKGIITMERRNTKKRSTDKDGYRYIFEPVQ